MDVANPVVPRHTPIVIVGSGFAGIGMAIRLKQSGFSNFILFERANDVGGTWRDNSYPGCACDVESMLYSYSFAPNPGWSRKWSPQPEILQYLRDCAQRFDIFPAIEFNTKLESAHWQSAESKWRLKTSRGEWTCDFFISAMGALSESREPELPGLKNFRGKIFHSARWDHTYDLNDRSVAVIGTGASAIQFVPHVQPQVRRLFIFQRTAPWILPHHNPLFTERQRRILQEFPWVQKIWRLWIYLFRELTGRAFHYPWMLKVFQKYGLSYLRRKVKDKSLRDKLTPRYTIGCKRILISSKYYPAVTQKNVEVVTEPILSVEADGIRTNDGELRKVDTLIFGTGFRLSEMHSASSIFGSSQKSLTQAWRGTPRAHLGTTVSGFPNFFMIFGPNTGLGHNSVVLMAESQINHVINALTFSNLASKAKLNLIRPLIKKCRERCGCRDAIAGI
jgi:cation diffusion facilitator CzcD-associated flavoprotein CzcO